jgi:hypothetical protein
MLRRARKKAATCSATQTAHSASAGSATISGAVCAAVDQQRTRTSAESVCVVREESNHMRGRKKEETSSNNIVSSFLF